LGYFNEVSIETQEVAGFPDQVDLTSTVAEKPTGSLSLGAGVSSADGLGLMLGFKQDNAFGSGNSLGVELNTSKLNRTVVFNTTDPYFTADGVSRTVDVYLRNSKPYTDENSYSLETSGASLRFGVPFSDSDTVFFGGGIERTTIVPGTLLPAAYQLFANQYAYSTNALPLTIGWARDTRDSGLVPSSGRLVKTSGEWSVGGDLRYVRGTAQVQQFFPLSKKVTLALNGEIAMGAGIGGLSFPLFKNYYSGGLGSVRGFQQGSLTTAEQRSQATPVATGGAKKITFNAEMLAPLPGGGNDRTLRMYGFFDVGGIYGSNEDFQLGDMRSSVGVGISWISPVGPLRLAWAVPVKKFASDNEQALQFQIGTTF
jgi:outer membrane protein insertion porin family